MGLSQQTFRVIVIGATVSVGIVYLAGAISDFRDAANISARAEYVLAQTACVESLTQLYSDQGFNEYLAQRMELALTIKEENSSFRNTNRTNSLKKAIDAQLGDLEDMLPDCNL